MEKLNKNLLINVDYSRFALYPVFYEGEFWDKKECDDMFVMMYTTRYALGMDGGVYVAEGMFVYPDGSMHDE